MKLGSSPPSSPAPLEGSPGASTDDERSPGSSDDKDKQDPDTTAPTKASRSPKKEEWSLPAKFIIKQRDFQIGKDFRKEETLQIYVSQNTTDPDARHQQMHSTMKFNVKSKDNYDKEYGTNQVYQFVFGREHLEQMLSANAERRAAALGEVKTKASNKNKDAQDWDVEYPNQIYVTIRGQKNCALDVAVQLTMQPELIDEATLKLQQMQKQKELVDYE